MTNDQIVRRLLDLFYNGELIEKMLVIEALCAIVEALEGIPNTEVHDALARAYTEGIAIDDANRLTVAAEKALQYPLIRTFTVTS